MSNLLSNRLRTKDYTGAKTLESMQEAKYYNNWTLKKFEKYLNGDILEVGCGIGSFTSILSKYGNVTAIDIDERLIKLIKNQSNNVKTGLGDIEKNKYFFNSSTFNTVVCLNVLEHIENDKKALQNIYKLLKEKGILVLLVPIHKFLYGEIDRSIHHFRRYDANILKNNLEKLGFTIKSTRKLNLMGALGWFFAGRILRNQQIDEGKIKIFNIFAPLLLFLEDYFEPPFGTSVLIIAQKGKD